jgi:hypothetical protein
MNDEVKTIHVHLEKPSRSKPGGASVTGHYRVDEKFVVLCRPDGVPIEFKGKKFRGEFGTKSGELSERELAGILTKDFRRELKHELRRNPDRPATFFGGAICYPPGY